MKLNIILRALCVASVAAVAAFSLLSQPGTQAASPASISEDFLVLAGSEVPAAKATPTPVLKDWEYTRARPAKCPFF